MIVKKTMVSVCYLFNTFLCNVKRKQGIALCHQREIGILVKPWMAWSTEEKFVLIPIKMLDLRTTMWCAFTSFFPLSSSSSWQSCIVLIDREIAWIYVEHASESWTGQLQKVDVFQLMSESPQFFLAQEFEIDASILMTVCNHLSISQDRKMVIVRVYQGRLQILSHEFLQWFS